MKEIPLTRGLVALVDDDDYERLNQHSWHAQPARRQIYAQSAIREDGKWRTVRMHRFILGVTDPRVEVDHIDHNGLNNRRGNLRACSKAENQHNQRLRADNTSGLRGVYLRKTNGKWRAVICVDGRRRHLGQFSDKEDAAAAYAKAARQLHGEFANPVGSGQPTVEPGERKG